MARLTKANHFLHKRLQEEIFLGDSIYATYQDSRIVLRDGNSKDATCLHLSPKTIHALDLYKLRVAEILKEIQLQNEMEKHENSKG